MLLKPGHPVLGQIVEEEVGFAIICDIDILPAIVVVVGDQRAETFAIGGDDAGLLGDIREAAIASVPIEPILLGAEVVGIAGRCASVLSVANS